MLPFIKLFGNILFSLLTIPFANLFSSIMQIQGKLPKPKAPKQSRGKGKAPVH